MPTPTDIDRSTQMVRLARMIEERAEETLTLEMLAGVVGLSPSRLQKVFKEEIGVSPRDYQEAVRLRRFKASLRQGENVTEAIFASGYGSVSRVYGEQRRKLGMKLKDYQAGASGEIIAYACRQTSLGLIAMGATRQGVCFVEFGDDVDSLISSLQKEFPGASLVPSPAAETPELDDWINALEENVNRGKSSPDIPLDMRGTSFQIQVWRFLKSIQEGDVLSYGDVAKRIGKPNAIRAVASACARNRIALLIPCHRVLRADGQLGGYRWGLERKHALLRAEKEGND
ncbi:bifunctional transcriptional activator/DNA repair enzyme AdaA [Marinobacter sp. F4206]|uniref:bifunctional transcriptional activator/DNA repair enzyme AdaA n=1 Tax=Marinobacter sp. F4206 TaxID=2861777 RepID=UPI001C5FCFF8|nr:methylated-DNA--[protein]-cysteine S-methyltransferase [Marinobacter sp. F4206]MBW4933116.1 methylated-DNA--[protein]-cysteine S-methyltransferase [Marinobacter sp. F4206]